MKKSILVAAIKENAKNILGLALLLVMSSQTALATVEQHFASPSGAGDCSQANPCNIATAVTTMSDPHGIVYLAQGSYTSTVDEVIFIDNNISILGGWDGTTTTPIVRNPDLYVSVIDGEGIRGGIVINDDHNTTIKGITITNAYTERPGAGLVVENSVSLTLYNLIFSNNYTKTTTEHFIYGGGAYVRGGTLNIENCTFSNNKAVGTWAGKGGGLAIIEANASIIGSNFNENTAWETSALYFYGVPSSLPKLELRDNVFNANGTATGSAYGIASFQYADTEIRNNSFIGNRSYQGNLIKSFSSNLTFTNNIISNNTSGWAAALKISKNPTFEVSNNIIVDNNSTDSNNSVIWTLSSQGLLAHNTIANNNADFAILVGDMSNTTNDDIGLVNNIITGHPIGIHVGNGAEINAESTLWGDLTQTDGPGIKSTVHDYTGNPDFKEEYHIGANSAAKDAGVAAGITTDIDGDARPQGDGYDIGADEFVTDSMSPALIMYLLN